MMHPNYLSEGFGQTVKRGRSSVSVTAYDTFDNVKLTSACIQFRLVSHFKLFILNLSSKEKTMIDFNKSVLYNQSVTFVIF